MIGKSSHPRCFKDINTSLLPFIYVGQRNAWMDTEIFTQWFHTRFVKSVRAALIARDVEPKALLLLDNCLAHPSCEELTSDDGQIRAMFLPPNVTSLIQQMDQGVLISIKRHYKKASSEANCRRRRRYKNTRFSKKNRYEKRRRNVCAGLERNYTYKA